MNQAQEATERVELRELACSNLQIEVWFLWRAGQSHTQIADALGISLVASQKHVARVRRRLNLARTIRTEVTAEDLERLPESVESGDPVVEFARTLHSAARGPVPSERLTERLPVAQAVTLEDWIRVARGW